MSQPSASLEIFRWGYAHLPGAVFFYARELELDTDDIGILSSIFYAFEQSKPLFESGVRAGQILQSCSCLTVSKLSRKLNRLQRMQLIELIEGTSKTFADKVVYLEPLFQKLEQLIVRDHPRLIDELEESRAETKQLELQVQEYRSTIEQLKLQLEEQEERHTAQFIDYSHAPVTSVTNEQFRRVADFIAKKTGNLLSVKMETELHKWLEELGFTPEFLLCMLELTFERNINNPREITRIAKDLKEYSINTVEGLESYFTNYVDKDRSRVLRSKPFDPDIIEFGNFTGIDMNAEARQKVYYKWRYDWGFTHAMIMKAGEIMCQRTKNGGLEYIDSVLNNWMSKEIRSVSEAEKEIKDFKARNKTVKKEESPAKGSSKRHNDYDIYVPPDVLEELKSKV